MVSQSATYDSQTILVVESLEDLQQIVNRIIKIIEQNGLSVNIKNTPFIVITKAHKEKLILYGEH